jgi:hypothetical protein
MSSTNINTRVDAALAPAATPASTRPVAVSELKRAWSAVQGGEFRHAQTRDVEPTQLRHVDERPAIDVSGVGSVPDSQKPVPQASTMLDEPGAHLGVHRWVPAAGERVLPVLGAAGSTGCSTVALCLATAAADHADASWASRVVECCSAPASGLAAASTAELGHHESGWVQGTRGAVLLERTSRVLGCAGDVPAPAPRSHEETDGAHDSGSRSLTVVDTGWEVGHLLAGDGWLAELVRQAPIVVVVARPTIPGFRRLEAALELLEAEHGAATQIAVLGGRRKRWAKGVEHSAGPRTRAALREDRVHEIPEDRHLAVAGLSSTPLPAGLVAAGEQLLAAALTTSLTPLTVSPSSTDGRVTASVLGGGHDVDDHSTTSHLGGSAESSTTQSHLDAGTHLGTGTNPEGTAR